MSKASGSTKKLPPMPARNEDMAVHGGIGDSTVYRTNRRFVLGSVEAALSEKLHPEG